MLATTAVLLAMGLVTGASGDTVTFDARLAGGPSARLDRGLDTEGFFELGGMLRIRLDGGHSEGFSPIIMPELSYTLQGGSVGSGLDHAGVLGCGYGIRHGPFLTGIVPGLVVGRFRGSDTNRHEWAGGLRVLAVAEIEHFIGVQLGYTAALRGTDLIHEVHASLSLNFMGLAVLYIAGRG